MTKNKGKEEEEEEEEVEKTDIPMRSNTSREVKLCYEKKRNA